MHAHQNTYRLTHSLTHTHNTITYSLSILALLPFPLPFDQLHNEKGGVSINFLVDENKKNNNNNEQQTLEIQTTQSRFLSSTITQKEEEPKEK